MMPNSAPNDSTGNRQRIWRNTPDEWDELDEGIEITSEDITDMDDVIADFYKGENLDDAEEVFKELGL